MDCIFLTINSPLSRKIMPKIDKQPSNHESSHCNDFEMAVRLVVNSIRKNTKSTRVGNEKAGSAREIRDAYKHILNKFNYLTTLTKSSLAYKSSQSQINLNRLLDDFASGSFVDDKEIVDTLNVNCAQQLLCDIQQSATKEIARIVSTQSQEASVTDIQEKILEHLKTISEKLKTPLHQIRIADIQSIAPSRTLSPLEIARLLTLATVFSLKAECLLSRAPGEAVVFVFYALNNYNAALNFKETELALKDRRKLIAQKGGEAKSAAREMLKEFLMEMIVECKPQGRTRIKVLEEIESRLGTTIEDQYMLSFDALGKPRPEQALGYDAILRLIGEVLRDQGIASRTKKTN